MTTQTVRRRAPRIKGQYVWPIPLNISYSMDYRDPTGSGEDTELTFVFIGSTIQVIVNAFEKLCYGGYIMKRYGIEMEHSCVLRNGHHYWRVAVMPKQYNPDFVSLEGLRALIEWRIRDQGHDITFIPDYNKFINI